VIAAWVLFPLVMLVLAGGCGLAVDWAAGRRLPATVLPSAGFALLIVIVSLAARFEKTAELATPAVIVVAILGYGLGRRRLMAVGRDSLARNAWALGAAAFVFCVCAAPMVLSGNATFLGYFVLNDGVFHFSLITQLLSHGHDLSRVPFSSYQFLLSNYINSNYPTGADLPIGIGSRLLGQDVAWLFQPEQALYMVLGALAVFELLSGAISSRPLRALATVVSALAATVFSYYLESSDKEVASAWLITATCSRSGCCQSVPAGGRSYRSSSPPPPATTSSALQSPRGSRWRGWSSC
jgi:hypothetical protein